MVVNCKEARIEERNCDHYAYELSIDLALPSQEIWINLYWTLPGNSSHLCGARIQDSLGKTKKYDKSPLSQN